MALANVQAKDLQTFYLHEMKTLSGTTVKHEHALLHKILKHAYRMDLISHNPADKVDPPRAERFEGASYTEEELALLNEKTWDHKLGLLIYINAFQPVGENKPFSPTSRFSANRRPISTRTRTEKALDFWWLSQKSRTFSCANCGGGKGIRTLVGGCPNGFQDLFRIWNLTEIDL